MRLEVKTVSVQTGSAGKSRHESNITLLSNDDGVVASLHRSVVCSMYCNWIHVLPVKVAFHDDINDDDDDDDDDRATQRPYAQDECCSTGSRDFQTTCPRRVPAADPSRRPGKSP